MQVMWQEWMRWINKKTGKLKPNAPDWVVERYNEYVEEYRKFKDPFNNSSPREDKEK